MFLIFFVSCKRVRKLEELNHNPYDQDYKGEIWLEELESFKSDNSYYNQIEGKWYYIYNHQSSYKIKTELFPEMNKDLYYLINQDSAINGSDSKWKIKPITDIIVIKNRISYEEYMSGGEHHYFFKIAVGNHLGQVGWVLASEYGSQVSLISKY